MATVKLVGAGDLTVTGGLSATYAFFARFTCEITATISEFKVKSNAAGNVKVAIYADHVTDDYPTTRLSHNDSSQAVAVGWNTLSIPSLAVTSGTKYWLAITTDGDTVGGYNLAAGVYKRRAQSGFAGWTWPDPAVWDDSQTNIIVLIAGWGIWEQFIYPTGIEQAIAIGTPAVSKLQLLIFPTGIEQLIAVGTPALTKRAAVSHDYPDWTESMQLTGTEIYLPVNIQGVSVTIPVNVTAVTIGTISVDIVAQTVGNIGIDIKAQTVGNISVNIAAQTGNINVNIAAQSGNVTIEVKAQTVAIKTQGEWSPQQGQQKYFVASATIVSFGQGASGDYTVTADKSLYITHFGFCVHAHVTTDGDKDQMGFCSLYNATTAVNMAFIGGNGGGQLSFPTPIKLTAGQVIRLSIATEANHYCDVWACWGGYEI